MNRIVLIACIVLLWSSCTKESNFADNSSGVKTGSLASFNIKDNFLLLIDQNRILTYDISIPDSPRYVSQYTDHNNILETLYVLGDNIYVGSQNAMLIFGISSTGQLELKGQASHIRSCDPVVVQEQYAYVTTRSGSICAGVNQLSVYDVTDIYYPQIVSVRSMTNPQGLAVNGDILYVCDLVDGIMVFDIADKSNPEQIYQVSTADKPKDIIILNSQEMLVLNEEYISFYDISEPDRPVFKYKYE